MSETQQTAVRSGRWRKSAAAGRGRRRSRRRLLPRSSRSTSCRPSSRPLPTMPPRSRRSPMIPSAAGLRQHHHGAGALRQAALEGRGRVLRPGLGALQSGDPGDRQGSLLADGAALEPDHDERGAVRPHRDAAREARHARPDGEQLRLLERTYTNFYRAGAGLDEAAKKRRAEINERLAQLGTSFSHHLLGDEQDWFMELGEDDRAGLPEAFVAAAKAAAEERGMAGKAIVTLSRSSVEPFLKSSSAATCARRSSRPSPRAATTATPTTTTPPSWRSSAARGSRQDHGLPDLRRLSAGGFHGQDAGSGAQPAGAGLEAGPRAGAGRSRRPAGADRGGGRQFHASPRGTGATTPRCCASAAPISTTPRSSPIWCSTT